jgi:hypothetical protein
MKREAVFHCFDFFAFIPPDYATPFRPPPPSRMPLRRIADCALAFAVLLFIFIAARCPICCHFFTVVFLLSLIISMPPRRRQLLRHAERDARILFFSISRAISFIDTAAFRHAIIFAIAA